MIEVQRGALTGRLIHRYIQNSDNWEISSEKKSPELFL